MGRKRIELTPTLEAEIKARTARGESAQVISTALGGALSTATIERRQRELRGGASPKGVPPASAALEGADVPEEVPEGTPLVMIDRWIARVEKGAAAAEAQGNLPALSSLAMRAASLAEARRRAMPLPKVDPNENPDMKALAAWGEKELLKRVHALFASPG